MTSIEKVCASVFESSKFLKNSKIFDVAEMNNQKIDQNELAKLRETCMDLIDLNYSNAFRLKLITYTYPFLILFGLLGNVLPLIMVLKTYNTKRKENRMFSFCLFIICAADLCVLIFGCLREFLEEVFSIKIRTNSIYSCKLMLFSVYLFSSFSSYIFAFIAA